MVPRPKIKIRVHIQVLISFLFTAQNSTFGEFLKLKFKDLGLQILHEPRKFFKTDLQVSLFAEKME